MSEIGKPGIGKIYASLIVFSSGSGQNRSTAMKPRINPFEKRKKEFARKERQKKKAERREIRDRERAERPRGEAGEDPDIAGIVPGPQPPLDMD
jgi:hypothetical protein